MEERFDHRTHLRNKKGNIIGKNLYRLRISKTGMEYERPPGSGNFYAPNNSLIRGPLKDKQDELRTLSDVEAEEQEVKLVEIRKAEVQKQEE